MQVIPPARCHETEEKTGECDAAARARRISKTDDCDSWTEGQNELGWCTRSRFDGLPSRFSFKTVLVSYRFR